jgi:hypothetical protein
MDLLNVRKAAEDAAAIGSNGGAVHSANCVECTTSNDDNVTETRVGCDHANIVISSQKSIWAVHC